MSALGQKQTFAVQKRMSALPPIADMCSATRYVRFVPIADIRYAARSTRVSISLRSIPKSIGLVKSASAPASKALRFVSASP